MKLPHLLLLFRFVAAPVVILLALFLGQESRFILITLLYLGVISDIFDGIIARKMNISNEKFRRMDSQVDIVFWLAIAIATWILNPKVIEENIQAIVLLLLTEGLCYLASVIKFGKGASTHAHLSKLWGLLLLASFTSLIGFGQAGTLFTITIIVGLLSHLDVLIIILLLPKWDHDIPSSYHAYRIRMGKQITRNKHFHG